jgi:outer membrane protein TolC
VEPDRGATADPTRALAVSALAAAQEAALRDRLEVQVLRTRIAQAAAAVDLARSKMAPEVNLVGQAQFGSGSQFQADSAAFIGLTLNWTVWSWGTTAYGIDEAAANLTKAKIGERALSDGVRLEVEAAWVDYQTALEQATLAAEAEKVARVTYDLTQRRLAAQAATTFDVVRAESDVTEARENVEVARAGALIARARLARAMGGTAEAIANEVML